MFSEENCGKSTWAHLRRVWVKPSVCVWWDNLPCWSALRLGALPYSTRIQKSFSTFPETLSFSLWEDDLRRVSFTTHCYCLLCEARSGRPKGCWANSFHPSDPPSRFTAVLQRAAWLRNAFGLKDIPQTTSSFVRLVSLSGLSPGAAQWNTRLHNQDTPHELTTVSSFMCTRTNSNCHTFCTIGRTELYGALSISIFFSYIGRSINQT